MVVSPILDAREASWRRRPAIRIEISSLAGVPRSSASFCRHHVLAAETLPVLVGGQPEISASFLAEMQYVLCLGDPGALNRLNQRCDRSCQHISGRSIEVPFPGIVFPAREITPAKANRSHFFGSAVHSWIAKTTHFSSVFAHFATWKEFRKSCQRGALTN